MKYLLIFLILPLGARADFIAGAGFEGGAYESDNKSTNSSHKPLVTTPFAGAFKGEIDAGLPYFTFVGGFNIGTGASRSQYDYTSSTNTSNKAQVTDLKTRMTYNRFSLGGRLKLIKLKYFRLFVGGGFNFGSMNFAYDKENFKSKAGNSTGYQEFEKQSYRGGYGEVGMEIIIDSDSGFRIVGQKSAIKSEKFKTLGDKKLNFNFTAVSLSFIQYINTGNW